MTAPRRSLILAGGGMRVAYQAGVLKALAEAGIEFSHVDGASGGTMNLAMMLSGLSPDEMIARWKSLDVHKFVSVMPFAKGMSPQGLEAMGDARGLINDVFPHLGIDIDKIRACTNPIGTFNVCNFSRKTGGDDPQRRHDASTTWSPASRCRSSCRRFQSTARSISTRCGSATPTCLRRSAAAQRSSGSSGASAIPASITTVSSASTST